MEEPLYCKIYLDALLKPDELRELMESLLESKAQVRTIMGKGLIVDIFENKRGSSGSPVRPGDEFLSWPYYLEVESESESDLARADFIRNTAALMRELRKRGIRVIPSSHFEDELNVLVPP